MTMTTSTVRLFQCLTFFFLFRISDGRRRQYQFPRVVDVQAITTSECTICQHFAHILYKPPEQTVQPESRTDVGRAVGNKRYIRGCVMGETVVQRMCKVLVRSKLEGWFVRGWGGYSSG